MRVTPRHFPRVCPAIAAPTLAFVLYLTLLAGSTARADLIGPPLPQPVSTDVFYSNTSVYSMQGELDPSRGFSYEAPSGGTITAFRYQLSQETHDTVGIQFAILRPTGTPNQFSKVHNGYTQTGNTYDVSTGVLETPANNVRIEAGDRVAVYNQYGSYQLGTLVPGTSADKIYTSASKSDPFVFSLWSRPVNAFIALNAEFTPDGGGAGSDSSAPKLSGFKFSPSKFKAGGKGDGATAAKKTKKVKTGSTIKLNASEVATVKITFESKLKGRKSGKKCKKASKKSEGKKCTLYKKVGTLSQSVNEGKNKIAFNGKIGSKKMLGSYRATAVATDEDGNSSTPRKTNFKVVK